MVFLSSTAASDRRRSVIVSEPSDVSGLDFPSQTHTLIRDFWPDGTSSAELDSGVSWQREECLTIKDHSHVRAQGSHYVH